ncbi:hypothetical protein BDW59DRAFT_9848 [Aspergillus cavernicola]|uniref:JmjC domain-containing protein n=1 Tax=Aspergillus cavernicola TaxID=176166 RepID=A0ABR4HLM9_9EURO
MGFTPDDLLDILVHQRKTLGENLSLQTKHDQHLLKFYLHTYNQSTPDSRRVSFRLQCIRKQLGDYIWILVATSVTSTQISRLQNFEEFLKKINSWIRNDPIPKTLDEKAEQRLQVFDNNRDSTLANAKLIGKRLSRCKGREWKDKRLFPSGVGSRVADTLTSDPSIEIGTNANQGVQDKQGFLRSIEAVCQVDEGSIIRVTCDEELNKVLAQRFMAAILWRGYTQHYPLHGIPSSPLDLLQELPQYNIEQLDVYNYAATTEKEINYKEDLDKIVEHFKAPGESRPPWNFLDIRNQILSRVPVHVNRVDLLRLARRRQAGSASKSCQQPLQQDYADHEFFLLSSRNSVSPLHVDTAGQLTYIIGISGRKVWYLPRKLTSETYEILATLGSHIPETYCDGWIKIEIMPGDLL